MIRALDLFCCAGGATNGLQQAGFHVTGIDIEKHKNYCGNEFIQMDIQDLDLMGKDFLKEFDFIWASPPCQKFTQLNKQNKRDHPDLIDFIRQILIKSGKPYVIENVPNAPLINPITLCGSSFGLRVRRHRCFESNFHIEPVVCNHEWQDQDKKFDIYQHGKWFKSGVVYVFGCPGGKGKENWNEAMGINWMTQKEIVEAIPPVYSKYIAEQFLMNYKCT